MPTKSEQVQAGLADYVEVADRITEFREKHPEGSFQVRFVQVPEPFHEKFIAVEARAYRTPDDERPGVDLAWEPVPGKTPYTLDSELMNASTSAVGRAIVYALAADTKRGIASANEVRARGGETSKPASKKQVEYILGTRRTVEEPLVEGGRPGLFDKATLGKGQREALLRYYAPDGELSSTAASKLITALKDEPEKGAGELLEEISQARAKGDENAKAAVALMVADSDVPFDTEGLE